MDPVLVDTASLAAGGAPALSSLLSLPFPPSAELARAAGLVRAVQADSENGVYSHELLVQPDADLDGSFVAFDVDAGELITLNGWLYLIEDIEP